MEKVSITARWAVLVQMCDSSGGDFVNTTNGPADARCRHIILDACSHGERADTVKARLEQVSANHARSTELSRLAAELNRAVCAASGQRVPAHLCSATGLLFDVYDAAIEGLPAIKIRYINAGHPWGVIARAPASFDLLGNSTSPRSSGSLVNLPFGFSDDTQYEEACLLVPVNGPTVIVTMTDGITELGASNGHGDALSPELFGELVVAALGQNPCLQPRRLLNNICDSVNERFPDAKIKDDACLSLIAFDCCDEDDGIRRPPRQDETESPASRTASAMASVTSPDPVK